MKKFLKWAGIIVGVLVLAGLVGFPLLRKQTKKHSPARTAEYVDQNVKLNVTYCSPFAKGREIFGGLVPYGETWRTGANEATTFTNNVDLNVGGDVLPAGTYTLWTVPNKDEWEVIWNDKEYGWGVNFKAEASREPEHDVASVTVPATKVKNPKESLTISFSDDMSMVLEWDDTQVRVPISIHE